MIRAVLFFAALFSIFVFPWPLTAVLSLVASYAFVPTAFITGILLDVLYNPGHLPIASLLGLIGSVFMYLVHSFAKTRIIGA